MCLDTVALSLSPVACKHKMSKVITSNHNYNLLPLSLVLSLSLHYQDGVTRRSGVGDMESQGVVVESPEGEMEFIFCDGSPTDVILKDIIVIPMNFSQLILSYGA